MVTSNAKELTRGDTGLYSVTLYDADGGEYMPTEGEAVTFYLMKKNCDDLTEAILVKDIPVDTMLLELEPSDTIDLQTGTYAYRIRLKDTIGHEWRVIKSQLKIIC